MWSVEADYENIGECYSNEMALILDLDIIL
jgi:hypothetical protein